MPQPERPSDGVAELTRRLLAETREELGKADAKAQILLASSGVVISVVLGGAIGGDWSPSDLDGGARIVWWVGVAVAAFGIASLGYAVFPRLLKSTEGRLTYFEDVLRFADVYEFGKALTAEESRGDRDVEQLFRLSTVVHRKYAAVRVAMGSLLLAVVLCAAAALFG
jgi:hypothetical protein